MQQRVTVPIIRYFVIAGAALFGGLLWLSDELPPASAPFATADTVGLPEPFKAPPDTAHAVESVSEPAADAPTAKRIAAGHAKRSAKIAKAAKVMPTGHYAQYNGSSRNIH